MFKVRSGYRLLRVYGKVGSYKNKIIIEMIWRMLII